MRSIVALSLLFPALVACNPSTDTGEFVGGTFSMTITGVSDDCNDGALNIIFLPEGDGTTNEFPDPLYVPGLDEVPWSGNLPLPDPFTSMSVTVDGVGDTRTIDDAQNNDILLDEDTYGDCLVDITTDVAMTILDNDSISATAELSLTNLRGDNCPVTTADPCSVSLDVTGDRASE